MNVNRVSTEVVWWIPGGSLVYSGTPKTRATWIKLTWRAYFAYWHLLFIATWILFRSQMTPLDRYRRQFDGLLLKPHVKPDKPLTGIEKEAAELTEAQQMWKELEARDDQ